MNLTPPWTPNPRYMDAVLSTEAPRIPWDVFVTRHFQWRAGEHAALLGPTGQGKTFLLTELLPFKPYVAVFATKPKDETMDALMHRGYQKFERWRSISARDTPRRIIWPDARRIDSVEYQREVFHDAFGRIFREGGWTVALDELWYHTNILKLGLDAKMFLLQGRSLGISLLAATQRPAFVPLEIYDQSTHLFFWRDNDDANLDRLSRISARNGKTIKRIVMNLEQFQVLYINTRTGEMLRTRVPY